MKPLSLTAVLFAAPLLVACAADSGSSSPQGTDSNSRALRSAEATSEVITLSAELSSAGLGGTAGFAPTDVHSRVADVVGSECGLVEIAGDRLDIDLGDCPGLSGSLSILYPSGNCLDPDILDPDPDCFGDLDVTVTAELEVDGIRIAGTFSQLISGDLIDASGSLEVDVNGDELDIDFDVEIRDDSTGCDLVNGTISVASPDGQVSVVADALLDCGGCPEAGSLEVEANGESVSIDFDSGSIEVVGADGELVASELTCESAF